MDVLRGSSGCLRRTCCKGPWEWKWSLVLCTSGVRLPGELVHQQVSHCCSPTARLPQAQTEHSQKWDRFSLALGRSTCLRAGWPLTLLLKTRPQDSFTEGEIKRMRVGGGGGRKSRDFNFLPVKVLTFWASTLQGCPLGDQGVRACC